MICFNGGQIYDPYHEKNVYGKTFSKEIAVKIINEALKRDLHIQGYNDTEILAVQGYGGIKEVFGCEPPSI